MIGSSILSILVLFSALQYQTAIGVIYGTVVDQDGQPAQEIGLKASPLGVALGAILPTTKTDRQGRFRIAVPWWGRWTVFADDEEAGYSESSTGVLSGDRTIQEVAISPDKPQAQFDFVLPPKAGFLHVRLTNARTGEAIKDIQVTVFSSDSKRFIFSQSCSSSRLILLPPNKGLLLHVKSPGFREWAKSLGDGLLLNVRSGARMVLEVELEPSDPRGP